MTDHGVTSSDVADRPEGADEPDCDALARRVLQTAAAGAATPSTTQQQLRRCLEDAPESHQAPLARALIQGAPPDALMTLAHDLMHDRRDLVRDAASDSLAGLGPAATPVLRQLLADEDRDVRWYATEALAREHSEEAIPLLVERLKDDDFSIRWVATNGLLDAGTASVVPVLRALARDEPALLFHSSARRVLSRVSASVVIHEQLAELVESLSRPTTTAQSQGLAIGLLKRLLGDGAPAARS